jgi:isoamylase
MLGEFASRFTGSPDLYEDDDRSPTASINFITAHDGFTLQDLVSYNEKHNEANGENNMDGEDHNRSCNYGVEGETADEAIIALRNRQKRNMLATLFLSQGVPMLVAGDELGRTQLGNNNAYCQDNEISWLNWAAADTDLLNFTRTLIELRKSHPAFCRTKWFQGQPIKGSGVQDIAWFLPQGQEMEEHNWKEDFAKSLAVFLNGKGIKGLDEQGRAITDDSFYVIFNAHHEPLQYILPAKQYGSKWEVVLDAGNPKNQKLAYGPGDPIPVEGRTVVVLKTASLL